MTVYTQFFFSLASKHIFKHCTSGLDFLLACGCMWLPLADDSGGWLFPKSVALAGYPTVSERLLCITFL